MPEVNRPRSEANCQFFTTTYLPKSPAQPSHHRHGNSKSCSVMHKSGPKRQGQRGLKRRHHFVVQAGRSEQPAAANGCRHGLDWDCTYTSIGTQSALSCVCVCAVHYMDGLPFTKSFHVRRSTESCRARDEACKRRERVLRWNHL